jgi:hypothetical protein
MYKKIILSLFLILSINSKSIFAQVTEGDSLALVELYDSTDGDNWDDNTNWNSGPVGTWYGVTVGSTRVIQLALADNNLVGSIPSSIGNLSSLEYLYLDNNQITGSIPPEIGNLSSLVSLHLDNNQITGSIPPEIGNLSSLIILYLYNNQITGSIPPEIGNLSSLVVLYLNNNQISGSIPPEIGNLSSLGYLYLNNNQISGSIPPEIGNLSSLEYLYLYDNELTGLPDLLSLTSLEYLRIQNNKFTFEDIEPNINVPATQFLYSPQDSVGESKDTIITRGSNFTMSVSVGGENNRYQWKKNGSVISGATDTSYTISSAEIGDAGSYICEITNTVATGLTLYSRPVTVTVPYITITSPNGGENWQVDSTYDITWASVVTSGNVRIGYSINNGHSWIQEATSTPDDGSYSWTIPDMPSDSCLVRITDTASGGPSDTSDALFEISPASYITVTGPNGGENWQADSTYDITWTSFGTTGNVRIEYSINNGRSWVQVTTSTVDDGSYSWTIPNTPSDSCFVRVKNWSGSPSDISNSVFRISPSAAVPPAKLPEVYSFGVKGITVDNHFELRYTLPEKAECILEVYDMKGTKIKELSEESPAGFYSRKIDMSGEPAGVYFIRMEANGKKFSKINKVVLVK